ncbi:hypothetical protein JQ615_07480 [Bradyrhizobium jicamae]|uniref:Riboflavin kinase n=1 Tax=Bradyrhizobium jicamae TaxID=280332 RepID=A0ABS5FEL0_9BRAD|nr:hypothetical protein [Bradyrhizobium jicamae]
MGHLASPMSGDAACLDGGRQAVLHVELDLTRQFNEHFGVLAVLEQRVFDGLGAIDEQAAIEAVLFLGDPLATTVAADEDD